MYPSLASLDGQSTLADLPVYNFRITSETWGNRVTAEFDKQPDLPGVLVMRGPTLVGLISREKFLEHLSRPFALELYMRRPIEVLLEAVRIEPLTIPSATSIHEAAHIALNRPRELVFEPIIVAGDDGDMRLLSVQTLLLAQSQLLSLANDTIRRQKEAADAANAAKSQFLANMSHEIRSPMNGIIGMTEILLETSLSDQQKEYLEMVRGSADWLVGVINDVLDFSKIEAGKLDLEIVEFNLREVLDDILRSLSFRAHGKGVELIAQFDDQTPDALLGDPVRLRQIITNLVSNAIKFTESGQIVVRAKPGDAKTDGVEIHFSVTDTGIGIPADRLDKVFQAFEQADGSTTRRFGGTGLGLSISTRLAELLGGRIWAESQVGRGSTFHFTAAYARGNLASQKSPSLPKELVASQVLVADDNPQAREVLAQMLHSWHITPAFAEDGPKAYGMLLLAAQSQNPYRLVLIDEQMPGMDGLELAGQMLSSTQLASVPIVLLTTTTRGAQRARQEFVNIRATAAKPLRPSQLLDAMMNASGLAPLAGLPQQVLNTVTPVELRGLRILLAEDNLVNQKLAVLLLEKQEHRVTVVGDGQDAVAASAKEKFDLILMDVQMPTMDGMQATQAIRERERTTGEHIPIIAMTAHAMKGDRERCLEAGMDGYLSKPIRSAELYRVIAEVLSHEDRLTVPAPHFDAPVASTANRIEWSDALVHTGGDARLLAEMIEVFLAERPKMEAEIRDSLAAKDQARLQRAGHTMKGSCGYFAVEQAYDLSQQIEHAGSLGDFATAATAWDELESVLCNLEPELAAFVSRTAGTAAK